MGTRLQKGRQAVFVVNPRSANGETGARWPALRAYLQQQGVEGETRFTQAPGEAEHFAREAIAAGDRLVVAVGGDGTINEVVNGFFGPHGALSSEAALGILPSGTGGDLIRTLGVARNPYQAAEQLARAETRRIDLGRAFFLNAEARPCDRYFVNIAEAGLGGAVVARVNRTSKRLGGFASFLFGTLLTFATYEAAEIELEVDEAPPRRLRAWNVVVGNGGYFGGGMRILPGAQLDDGCFDVMVVGDVARLDLFRNVGALYAGTHLSQPGVEHFRARRIHVRCERPLLLDLDGEQPGTTDATFEVLAQALTVRC